MDRRNFAIVAALLCAVLAGGIRAEDKKPVVVLETSMGTIEVELYPEKAPITVANFLAYVNDKFYDNTVFHRVVANFVIQGGGFTADGNQKPTKDPIKNEAGNGLKNEKGTICMARTPVVDSATSQFFINLKDNIALDHTEDSPRGFGYCVYGKVISGMDVVEKIGTAPTQGGVPDGPPAQTITLKSATVKK